MTPCSRKPGDPAPSWWLDPRNRTCGTGDDVTPWSADLALAWHCGVTRRADDMYRGNGGIVACCGPSPSADSEASDLCSALDYPERLRGPTIRARPLLSSLLIAASDPVVNPKRTSKMEGIKGGSQTAIGSKHGRHEDRVGPSVHLASTVPSFGAPSSESDECGRDRQLRFLVEARIRKCSGVCQPERSCGS